MKALESKEINYLVELSKKERVVRGSNEKRKIWGIVILLLVCAVCLSVVGTAIVKYVLLTGEAIELELQISESQALQDKNLAIQQSYLQMKQYNDNYEAVENYLLNVNEISKENLTKVFDVAEKNSVEVLNTSYDGYGLSLNCITTNYHYAPKFVQSVKQLDFVADSEYNGFYREAADSNLYSFNIYINIQEQADD